jgi:RluA family pseudouridine synthase
MKKYQFIVTAPLLLQSPRLDQVVAHWASLHAPELSRTRIRKCIQWGAVWINQKRCCIQSKSLRVQDHIKLYYQQEHGNPVLDTPLNVIYEDQGLIVVNKPAGIPSVATLDQNRQTLAHGVETYLKKSNPHAYLGIHHRLDKDTSGLLLFVKDPSYNAGVAKLFQEKALSKDYLAWVFAKEDNLTQDYFEIRNYVKNKAPKNAPQKWGQTQSGGLFAHTRFKVLKRAPPFYLLQATPVTGRTHQIRVHLSEYGCAVLGDTRYGGKLQVHGMQLKRTMLHAAKLSFMKPESSPKKQPVTLHLQCMSPADFTQLSETLLKNAKLTVPLS